MDQKTTDQTRNDVGTSGRKRVPPRPRRERVVSLRRSMGQESVLKFGQAYLPGHFSVEPSAMHREIDGLLCRASEQRGMRIALAAPRGHAKSTLISLAYVLWSVCYHREAFVVIISDTADQAVGLLGHIRQELEANPRLREDFPDACAPAGSPGSWRQGEITLRSGARITALGAEQKIRGRRHGAARPTLIVLDDIENEDLAKSPEKRERRWAWLTGSLLNAGCSTTNIVAAGTLLNVDSILARLVGVSKPDPESGCPADFGLGWERRVYKAVTSWSARSDLWDKWEAIVRGDDTHDGLSGKEAAHAFHAAHREAMLEGAGTAWPQRETYERLILDRLEVGARAFDAEKQNEPSSPERSLFREEDFHYWDDERSPYQTLDQLLAGLQGRCYVFAGVDPSMGKAGRNADDSAIVTLLKPWGQQRVLYVVDADIRRRKPDEIIEALVQLQRVRRCNKIGVEATQFQDFLRMEIERRMREQGLTPVVKGIIQSTDKLGRIQRLQPLIASGVIRFSRRHARLMDQLRKFPTGAHDDGPDALEMAVRVSEMSVARIVQLARGA